MSFDMNSARPRPNQRPVRRPALVRGADGRLRPDDGNPEIGDIWAHQRRLSLKQAIAEDRRQAAKDRLRRERGLVGLATVEIRIIMRRLRRALFGTESSAKKLAGPAIADSTPQPAVQPPVATTSTKSIEITFALPAASKARLRRRLAGIQRPVIIATSLAVLAVGGILVVNFITHSGATATGQTDDGDTSKPANLQPGTPDYKTLLPAGKPISQLGGWKRVSPAGRDPVYAFADKLAGIQITVSQQPLPASFKKDTDNKIAEMAKSFGATKTVSAGNTTTYIGTSAKGPQSVIFSLDQLLILIKSDANIPDSQWQSYINSLR